MAAYGARLGAGAGAQRQLAARACIRIAELVERAHGAAARAITQHRAAVASHGAHLEALAPTRVLERGYALVRDETGHVVTSAAERESGEALAVQFHDGRVGVVVTGTPASPRRPAKRSDAKQGSLL
jgi:exodeoxyribonuclease VII large subunit